MYKAIDKILEKFKNKDGSDENSYYEYIEETNGLELSFEEELTKIFQEIGIIQYDFCNIGGFVSPGYSITCLCISYIDLEGRLQTIPVNYESL